MRFALIVSLILILLISFPTSDLSARSMPDQNKFKLSENSAADIPAYCTALHDVGKWALPIHNAGYIGAGGYDCFTGTEIDVFGEYPKGSHVVYAGLCGLWIGAIRGTDTLVSTAYGDGYGSLEFAPDISPYGEFEYRSLQDPASPDFIDAVSEQDFLCTYTDTFLGNDLVYIAPDFFRKGPHKPLSIRVRQESYAWSYDYIEDAILFNLTIENFGTERLSELYLGLYIDIEVGSEYGSGIQLDDICGFLKTTPSDFGCTFEDTVNIAWTADNDGDPIDGQWVEGGIGSLGQPSSARHVVGARILQPPSEELKLSFNWWVGNNDPFYDFGPQGIDSYRDFKTGGLGTPEGDLNKYHVLSNYEFDYDQVYTNQISPWDTNWIKPNQQVAPTVSVGGDCRYLLSYGAFNLEPGASIPIAFAYIAGENFHTKPGNINFLPDDPESYYSNVDFSDLALNSMWAEWVYDNPGVDTDSDGYAGDFRVCVFDSAFIDDHWVATVADTQYYRGDGVPDWRAAAPPPAPQFWLEPTLNGIRVRFNGHRSETTKDIFSNIIDFEGYRIYMGRDDREASLSLVASFDQENYDKYIYNPNRPPTPGFEIDDIPLTIEELRCLYSLAPDPCNDSTFDPLLYTRSNPYHLADSLFYFEKHDYNQSRVGIDTPIRKVYPNEPKPNFSDTLQPEQLTEEGNPKYYEYEFFLENLLPTVPYFITVTAFDFGSPKSNLEALETSKLFNIKSAYPFSSQAQVDGTADRVYIYPNPYIGDGRYREAGFEGRTESNRIDDRVRRIHFENLPAHCRIRIFSIDGDLVREIHHDYSESDPNYRHDSWDLINRNIQRVVSGLYYWTVEPDEGEVQIGKLVIIL